MNLKRLQTERIRTVLLFLAVFFVFRLSSVHTVFDSKYALLLSQQLLWQHSFSVGPEALPEFKAAAKLPKPDMPPQLYQLEQVGQRFYYVYPPAAVVLSMPFVALENARGLSVLDPSGTYDAAAEMRMQADLAAFLMAGLVVVIFRTARLLLPENWSFLVAGGAAFGTQIWSTASRALWPQTWGVFILGLVIWLLLRAEVKRWSLRPVLLATCLSWLYFSRPTYCVPIVAIAIFLCVRHRAVLIPYVLTGGAWLALFVGYSRYHFGQWLPGYYRLPLTFGVFGDAIAGNLISPSRGLLIYVPVLAFIFYLLLRYRRNLVRPEFVLLALGVVIVHLIVISGFTPWHAGHSYGPRLTTDLVPWFALLGILALKTRLQWRAAHARSDSLLRWRMEWACGALLLLCGVTFHAIGANSQRPWRWNVRPTNIDATPGRVWDWSNPQFIGAARDAEG